MNILLTGINGFIGRHVADKLISSQINIVAPVRENHKNSKIIKDFEKRGVKIITGNFYNENLLNKIFEYKIDAVIHLASIRGEGFGSWDDYYKVNVLGTEKLLKFSKKNGTTKFIYCSSVGVLGTIPKSQPANSNDEAAPDNFYHKSKWQSEQLVKNFDDINMNRIIIRPTITYGEGDDGFVPKLIQLVASKKFIFPKKDIYIHLLSVEAFADFIHDLLYQTTQNGSTYIMADRDPVLLSKLVDKISINISNKTYPNYYQFPMIFFETIKFILKIINFNRYLSSIQLISQNWTYDISATVNDLNYKPYDTFDAIKSVISNYWNNK